MTAKRIPAPARPDGSAASYSRAVWAGNLLYVTGQIGVGADGSLVSGGVAAETRQAFRNIDMILKEAGLTRSDIVKCNVWIADESDFAAYDDAYCVALPAPRPARSTMICGLIMGAMIEIEVVAYRPG